MALQAYDPTRGYLVPVSQARVVAYVIDTETGKRYSTVAEAQSAASPKEKTITSTTYEGTGKNRVKIVKYSDGTEERTSEPEVTPEPTSKRVITGTGTKADPLKVNGEIFSGTLPENNVFYENGVVYVYTPPTTESKTTGDLTPTDKQSFDATLTKIVESGGKSDIGYTFGTPTGEPMPGSVVPSAQGMKTFNYIPVSSMSDAQKRTYGIVLSDPNIDAVFFDEATGTMYYRFKDGGRGSGDKGAFYRDPLGNIRPSSEIPYNYSTGFYPSGSGGLVTEPYAPFSVYEGVSGVSQPGTLATGSQPFAFTGSPSFTNVSSSNNKPDGSNVTSGPTLAKDVFKQTLALYFGQSELTKGWMDELYNVVSKYYRSGTDVATSLNMALLDARNNPNLKTFTDRFKGIYALQDLRQAGKPVNVPTIAEYVAAQTGMADIFRESGLGELGTEQFTGELIGKGNSVTSVAEKMARAFQRIDMAPKEIKDTLSRYFPTVDRTILAKTLLLGQKGVDQLVDELNKYDVLAAAEQQGVGALGATPKIGGVTEERAQEYARRGYSYSEILPKFAQVRQVTPEVTKLSGISKKADIGQLGVEQAIISGLSQPMETIQQLGEEEIGRFSGKAGRAELGLASQRRANRAF